MCLFLHKSNLSSRFEKNSPVRSLLWSRVFFLKRNSKGLAARGRRLVGVPRRVRGPVPSVRARAGCGVGPCFVSESVELYLCACLSGPGSGSPACVCLGYFSKGIGGGAGPNFAFLLVEINQSWGSRVLAVTGPRGDGLRKEGRRAKVRREEDWLQGKRSISAGRPGL